MPTPRFEKYLTMPARPASGVLIEPASVAAPAPRRTGRLYNGKQIAQRLGLSEWWIQMAKRAGLRFDCGNRTYLETVTTWIAAHPDFRPSDWAGPQHRLRVDSGNHAAHPV